MRHVLRALVIVFGPLAIATWAAPVGGVPQGPFDVRASDQAVPDADLDLDVDPLSARPASAQMADAANSLGEVAPCCPNVDNFDFQTGCKCGGSCGGGCNNGCNKCCCRGSGFWGRAEALSFWIRGSQAPPLLTTAPVGSPQTALDLSSPLAQVLYPTGDLNRNAHFGGRFTLGYWLDPQEMIGFQGNFFLLANQHPNYYSSAPLLGRPFFNTATGMEDSVVLSYPALLNGSASITTTTRLMGSEANYRQALLRNKVGRVDFLVGYRFLRFDDAIGVGSSSTSSSGVVVPVNTNIQVNDMFGTKNIFNGGQVGLIWQANRGRWGLDATTKLAMGGLYERISVAGTTTTTVPGNAPVTSAGGILALASNSGTFGRTVFSLVPELNSNLTYQITPLWKANVGYTLLYMTQVYRASDQIDRNINPAQFPPPTGTATTPAQQNHSSTLWVQGISAGLECRF